MDDIRFSIRHQYRDGCAWSFTTPTRVIYTPGWGYVTLFHWDEEVTDYVFSEVYQSWADFAEVCLPDKLRADDPASFHDRSLVLDEV